MHSLPARVVLRCCACLVDRLLHLPLGGATKNSEERPRAESTAVLILPGDLTATCAHRRKVTHNQRHGRSVDRPIPVAITAWYSTWTGVDCREAAV